jgi:hypothetical protein
MKSVSPTCASPGNLDRFERGRSNAAFLVAIARRVLRGTSEPVWDAEVTPACRAVTVEGDAV